MAFYAKDIYTADGSTQSFAVTYPFISRDHVSVTADGVAATFTWVNDGQITITSPAALDGEILIIKRNTSPSSLLVDYVDGSNLTETDLDLDSKQAFFLAQENNDEQGLIDVNSVATSTNIFVADGTDFNSVTVTGDVTITSAGVTAIGADKITGANIADEAINSEHYTDGSIDTAHIADVNVTTAKIANDAITGAKIALFDDAYEATTTHILVADGTDFDNVAMTGDIAITNAGVTSIASGVIINADVKSDAAIDATKIHNGTISNTEFSYLNGVSSNIQTQLQDIVAGTVSNVQDNTFRIQDNADNTKEVAFEVSGVSSGTTRTFTFPDESGTLTVGGMGSLVGDTSPQLGGFLDANGNYIQMQKGGDISSASPTVIDTDGDYFICTGTTGFSAMTVAADRHFFLEFAAVLTMTHGAGTLDLPSGANIATAAGDVGEFVSTASNVVTCVNYSTASGKALVESVTLANSVTLTNKTLTAPAVTNLTGTLNSPTGTIGAYTLGGAVTGGDQTISAINLKDYGEVTNAIGSTGGGTQDIDLTLGNSVSATVDTSANTFTFSNPTASDELCGFTLMLTNGGSQTVNWPGTVDWAAATAPELTASGVDCLVFWTIDGGTIWNGAAVALTLS